MAHTRCLNIEANRQTLHNRKSALRQPLAKKFRRRKTWPLTPPKIQGARKKCVQQNATGPNAGKNPHILISGVAAARREQRQLQKGTRSEVKNFRKIGFCRSLSNHVAVLRGFDQALTPKTDQKHFFGRSYGRLLKGGGPTHQCSLLKPQIHQHIVIRELDFYNLRKRGRMDAQNSAINPKRNHRVNFGPKERNQKKWNQKALGLITYLAPNLRHNQSTLKPILQPYWSKKSHKNRLQNNSHNVNTIRVRSHSQVIYYEPTINWHRSLNQLLFSVHQHCTNNHANPYSKKWGKEEWFPQHYTFLYRLWNKELVPSPQYYQYYNHQYQWGGILIWGMSFKYDNNGG